MMLAQPQLGALMVALEEYGTRRGGTGAERSACYAFIIDLAEKPYNTRPSRAEMALVRAAITRKLKKCRRAPAWREALEPLMFV